MKNMKTTLCLLATMLIGVAVLPNARADEWNKKTIMTFSQAVEVPGKILPAGTYTFRLLDSQSDRHIVQIFDADNTHLITTVIAINDYRLRPTGETVVKFSEQPADAPEALKAWFYPGDNFGQEFVYPKKRAMELAQLSKSTVPSSEGNEAPMTAYNSEQKEVEVNKEFQTSPSNNEQSAATTPAPAETANNNESHEAHEAAEAREKADKDRQQAEQKAAQDREQADAKAARDRDEANEKSKTLEAHNRTELPQTGSSMPLIALLAAISLSLAAALKLFVKQ